ncbi:MAG: DUF998 domain-containing protein [Sphingobacteriales bacterium]
MSKNHANDSNSSKLLISYLTLRKSVGVLGIALPFVLIIGSYFFSRCEQVQPSISHYYYTVMGTYFTGTLCAVGLFLFSYKGYTKMDNITANLASLFALLVAFFPTDAYNGTHCAFVVNNREGSVNPIHFTAAALLFGCFAFFCLYLFTQTKDKSTMTPRKKARNRVYITCGIIIIFCIAAIALISFINSLENMLADYKPVLVLETIALIAFGTSWITKGEVILKDK